MASSEWDDLERLSASIEELRQRRTFAEITGNAERAAALADDIRRAEAEHERLVELIMARLVKAA